MTRHIDGEHINLIWDGTPDAFYLKGHIEHSIGINTLLDEGVINDGSEVGQAVHKYGRWSTQGDTEWTHTLREYKNPGRGRFKITVFGVGIFAKGVENE